MGYVVSVANEKRLSLTASLLIPGLHWQWTVYCLHHQWTQNLCSFEPSYEPHCFYWAIIFSIFGQNTCNCELLFHHIWANHAYMHSTSIATACWVSADFPSIRCLGARWSFNYSNLNFLCFIYRLSGKFRLAGLSVQSTFSLNPYAMKSSRAALYSFLLFFASISCIGTSRDLPCSNYSINWLINFLLAAQPSAETPMKGVHYKPSPLGDYIRSGLGDVYRDELNFQHSRDLSALAGLGASTILLDSWDQDESHGQLLSTGEHRAPCLTCNVVVLFYHHVHVGACIWHILILLLQLLRMRTFLSCKLTAFPYHRQHVSTTWKWCRSLSWTRASSPTSTARVALLFSRTVSISFWTNWCVSARWRLAHTTTDTLDVIALLHFNHAIQLPIDLAACTITHTITSSIACPWSSRLLLTALFSFFPSPPTAHAEVIEMIQIGSGPNRKRELGGYQPLSGFFNIIPVCVCYCFCCC